MPTTSGPTRSPTTSATATAGTATGTVSVTIQNIAIGNPVLSGTVTTLATWLPVAGANVSAWNTDSGAWTGAGVTNGSGAYSISLPAGSYKLLVQPTSGPPI